MTIQMSELRTIPKETNCFLMPNDTPRQSITMGMLNIFKKKQAVEATSSTRQSRTTSTGRTKPVQKCPEGVLFGNGDHLTKEQERREKAYQWWTRCGRPSKQSTKKRIADTRKCEVSQKDVDLLPWLPDGSRVDEKKMMQLLRAAH